MDLDPKYWFKRPYFFLSLKVKYVSQIPTSDDEGRTAPSRMTTRAAAGRLRSSYTVTGWKMPVLVRIGMAPGVNRYVPLTTYWYGTGTGHQQVVLGTTVHMYWYGTCVNRYVPVTTLW